MSLKDRTPEQRAEMLRKSHESRRRNAEARRAARAAGVAPEPEVERLPVPPIEDDDDYAGYELSADERATIEEEVKKRLRADRRAAAKKAYMQDVIDRERRAAGEEPPDEAQRKLNEEMVWIYIQLPRLRKPTGGRHEPEQIILDGMVYRHGQHREVTRAVAVTLLDIMDKAGRHVRQVDGDSMVDFNPNSFRLTYQGGSPMSGGSLGTSFDALHRRAR
jgi:hypothetical protein